MRVNQYPTGYVDIHCFERVNAELFTYHSPIQHRDYTLHLVNSVWTCNCPDAHYIAHKQCKCCKHEKALSNLWEQHQRKSLSMRQAEAAAAKAERQADRIAEQNEIAVLRAEVFQLSCELRELREYQAATPDLTAIITELAAIKAENAEIKKQLAGKATARKKHMTETEAAQIKEGINTALDDAMQQAESAIRAAKMAKDQLADLEAIPHYLKQELDRQAEAGKEELQPDYKAPDYNAPEVKAAVREAQEADRKRRKRHENSRLGEGVGFSLLK